ncbi:proline racemase [Sedimentibacter acidaminivorans]|uniref:Proline racemase n=1 Tax=Sedimentibacter acidaminivorans TaxID=913099 RepID=A0ABS4GCT0_9FIRM|nr:proline racemase family protein [Sedimentibacter acidaminivorans]MBP1925510.1 proline racemase [Sedimentibacter acidaminivorans]
MNLTNHIFTVDSHVMGEPLRIVTGGIPFLKGNSITEKKTFFAENFDHFRSALILEPRGHDNMFGAIFCEPVNKLADIGIFFMHSDGYLNMCGHGIIGAVTSIIELGLIKKKIDKVTEVILETPAGLIYAYANVEDGLVKNVAFRNVPSFVLYSNFKVPFPGLKDVSVDIAYGGNFFCLVSARELSIEVKRESIQKLIFFGMKLLEIINDTAYIYHPDNRCLSKVELVEIYDSYSSEKLIHKNCVVFGNNQVDRSPCGSGTSAMLALKYFNNQIKINEPFINESIIGTKFTGKVVEEVKVGNFDAIIPEIQGKSYITGNHHFIINNNDPLCRGITLN